MLVLTRRTGERVFVGPNITVKVVEIRGEQVRLGFDAPPETTILREEVQQRMAAGEPLHRIEDDLDYRENQEKSRK